MKCIAVSRDLEPNSSSSPLMPVDLMISIFLSVQLGEWWQETFRQSYSFYYFLNYDIFYWLCYCSYPTFSPHYSPPPCTPLPPSFPPALSSCPWIIYISSLASPFPILSLTSHCLFCTYHLCCLFFSPILLPHPPYWYSSMSFSISVNLFLF